ncbi:Uncharacterised protein [Vibrio cholerae]|uniref:Uncharacterized protein n=1 Tax=Vibrio cholerae TaxID=666 RepID=A0A655WDY6_VIBCL|nr:Uncharacterised protein [Vibrio cholerae]CSB88821.1 Uncharacterised protein [Vibrio cholerae]
MLREALRVDGRRGDDDFEIGTTRQKLLEIAQDKVDVEAALVRFIDNDGVVLVKETIVLDLRQQDTVSHQFDLSLIRDLIGKANFIAHKATELGFHLFGNAVCH